MSFFHQHQWVVAAKTFAPPAYGLKLGECWMTEHMAKQLTFGVTTVLLHCECGSTKVIEMFGPEILAEAGTKGAPQA